MLIPSNPEVELQFRLLQRIGSNQKAQERIQDIITADLDWESVISTSSCHGTLPLLHAAIRDLDLHPPEAVKKSLRETYEQRALANIDHVKQLNTVVQTLRCQGIRVIPYKGPMLTRVAYDELGLRWFSDLDLLVAPENILEARETLLENGYRQTNLVGVPPTELVDGSIFRWGGEFHFDKDDCIPVELRYRFVGKLSDAQSVFYDLCDNQTSRQIAGIEFPSLSLEDRLIILLAHGTKHGWNRLSWIYDIALLSQNNINWKTVLRRSEKYGWQDATLLGLAVASELANIELPPIVRQSINNNIRAQFGASIIQKLYQDPNRYAEMNVDTLMSVLYLNKSIVESTKELADIVFSPWEKDYQWVSLPPQLYPLYYLVRPCRLSVSMIRRIVDR